MIRRQHVEMGTTVIMCLAALGMVSIQAYRFGEGRPTSEWPTEPNLSAEEWSAGTTSGIRLGSPDADLVLVGFIDFTCPYCQRLLPVLDSLRTRYPDRVAVVFHHFPLSRSLSLPSAMAAECAEQQGRFPEMSTLIYSTLSNNSSDVPDWADMARIAGVHDAQAFEECMGKPRGSFPRIAAGIELGKEWGVRGTPTVYVNRKLTGARELAEYEELLGEIE